MTNNVALTSPFTAILSGDEPGTIIARDDAKRFAIIASMEPEAAVHWLAVPYEAGQSTEELEQANPQRFLQLVEYAVRQAREKGAEHQQLENGFTIKIHFGAYETVPHAKLHILSKE